MANRHTLQDLYELQALPLDLKVRLTKQRIREWIRYFGENGVYVSFSGGKDSTVLLDIVREDYPNVKAMFVDVPTQYPELRDFVKTYDNVDIVRPRISFAEVCKRYGFPLISKEVSEAVYNARKYLTALEKKNRPDRQTDRVRNAWAMADLLGIEKRGKGENKSYELLKKGIIPSDMNYEFGFPMRLLSVLGKVPHKEKGKITNEYSDRYDKSRYRFFLDAPFEISSMCCNVMKKNPAHKYQKETGKVPFTAQMASESRLRAANWVKYSCNGFELKSPISNPMSFWTEQDVLLYIKAHDLKICSVYGDVVTDDEEWGQIDFAEWTGNELFELGQKPLHCTGCSRTGCVLCGFGAHMNGDDRYLKLKETHPGLYGLLDKIENNGYTMRQAIEWTNEHGKNIDIKL